MKLLAKYIAAMTHLYGIAPKHRVLETYNDQNQKQLAKEEFYKQIEEMSEELEEHFVVSIEDYFVEDSLLMMETDIPDLLAEQSDKPYYVPKKQQLLRYADEFYFEKTPAYKKFSRHMENYISGDREYTREVCEEIYAEIRLAGDPGEIFESLESLGFTMRSEEEVKQLFAVTVEMFCDMRLWQNNGHTINELLENGGNRPEHAWDFSLAVQFFDEDEV